MNRTALYETLNCESGFNPDAVGLLGEQGIAQIYLKYHPDITKAEARDPNFGIRFAAKSFKDGNAAWWSCYKIRGFSASDALASSTPGGGGELK